MSHNTALCDASDSLLAIIDIQGRLLPAMPVADREQVLENSHRLLRGAAMLDIPTLITEQYPRGLGHTDPRLMEDNSRITRLVEKTTFSACGAEEFIRYLDYTGRSQVVVTGMEAHVCVLQTVLDLQSLGKQVFLVEDAVCSRDPANRSNAIARMRDASAIICNRESVLFEWLRDSKHPRFRDISKQLII
jgi:nicotinamidase-related amidase